MPLQTTVRIAAFMPGESPPLVGTAMRFIPLLPAYPVSTQRDVPSAPGNLLYERPLPRHFPSARA